MNWRLWTDSGCGSHPWSLVVVKGMNHEGQNYGGNSGKRNTGIEDSWKNNDMSGTTDFILVCKWF